LRSNTVTVKVYAPALSILSVSLAASKTEIEVGGEVMFTVTVVLNRKVYSGESATIGYDVYVNGAKVKTGTIGIPEGNSKGSSGFALKFTEPGVYEVYVDASFTQQPQPYVPPSPPPGGGILI